MAHAADASPLLESDLLLAAVRRNWRLQRHSPPFDVHSRPSWAWQALLWALPGRWLDLQSTSWSKNFSEARWVPETLSVVVWSLIGVCRKWNCSWRPSQATSGSPCLFKLYARCRSSNSSASSQRDTPVIALSSWSCRLRQYLASPLHRQP